MAVTVTALTRAFKYGGMTLKDLFPEETDPKQALIKGYGKQYPELNFVELGVGNDLEGVLTFDVLKKALGTKG